MRTRLNREMELAGLPVEQLRREYASRRLSDRDGSEYVPAGIPVGQMIREILEREFPEQANLDCSRASLATAIAEVSR